MSVVDQPATESDAEDGLLSPAEAIGLLVLETSHLEMQLATCVTSLSQSPLTSIIIRGERGTALVEMALRLLDEGIGSSAEDQASGRTQRLDLISHSDSENYRAALKSARGLLDVRDRLAHGLWILREGDNDRFEITIRRRNKVTVETWTTAQLVEHLDKVRLAGQALFVADWNALAHVTGMDRMPAVAPAG